MPAINRFCQRTTHIARMARSYSRRRAPSRVRAGHARDQPLLHAAPTRYLHLAPPMCPVHRVEMEGLGVW